MAKSSATDSDVIVVTEDTHDLRPWSRGGGHRCGLGYAPPRPVQWLCGNGFRSPRQGRGQGGPSVGRQSRLQKPPNALVRIVWICIPWADAHVLGAGTKKAVPTLETASDLRRANGIECETTLPPVVHGPISFVSQWFSKSLNRVKLSQVVAGLRILPAGRC